ncbi:hypothetical protein [Paraburkholderia sediminicola]|uniref:hypothetical protein n=1 Tax=Paraburkholderia sediminicola TaxID=458836 RepID=UPI0038B7136C
MAEHACCRVVLVEGNHRCPVAFIFGAGERHVVVLPFVVLQVGRLDERQVEVGRAFGIGASTVMRMRLVMMVFSVR